MPNDLPSQASTQGFPRFADPPSEPARVVVTDIDVSFAQMVTLLLKLAFASIPAAIIFGFVAVCVGGLASLVGIAGLASLAPK